MAVVGTVLPPWDVDYTLDEFKVGTLKWSSQFTDDSAKNVCPVTSCKLYAKDCKAAVDSRVTLTADPWTMSMKTNEPEGYSADVCVECSNGDQAGTKAFSVTQRPRCIKRMTAKASAGKLAVLTFTGDAKMGAALSNIAETFFENDNADGECPVTTCSLQEAGCTKDWTETSLLAARKSGGVWELAADFNAPYGYIREVCIRCTNGGDVGVLKPKYWPRQTITYDNYKIQLPSRCNYAMTERVNIPTIYSKNHDDAQVVDPVIVSGFGEFFENADAKNCPVKYCKLYNPDCKTLHSQDNLKMDATSPWKITIGDNVENGYQDAACMVCGNEW